ncbi:MAG: TadE/TadG family type IV pilus assembly protein [Candidatus Velamenicoccus archaeovorus]
MRERIKSQRGAAAVEFAIIAPLLFMLIFGIVEFGLVWSQKNVYVGAAREGARYAAVRCQPDGGSGGCTLDLIRERVRDAAVGYPANVDDASFAVAPSTGCTAAGGEVKVSWTQPMAIQIPFLPDYNLSVPIEAVFRCE